MTQVFKKYLLSNSDNAQTLVYEGENHTSVSDVTVPHDKLSTGVCSDLISKYTAVWMFLGCFQYR